MHDSELQAFHSQERPILNFACSLTRNITYVTQYGELGFSQLTQMKYDHTTNSHYITHTWLGECTFELIIIGSENLIVKLFGSCSGSFIISRNWWNDILLAHSTMKRIYGFWTVSLACVYFVFMHQASSMGHSIGDMERQAQFLKHPQGVLEAAPSKVLSSTVSFSSLDCSFKCLETASCLSFNYGIHSQLCQLLSTDKYNSAEQFGPSAIFHHYSIRVSQRTIWFSVSDQYD